MFFMLFHKQISSIDNENDNNTIIREIKEIYQIYFIFT